MWIVKQNIYLILKILYILSLFCNGTSSSLQHDWIVALEIGLWTKMMKNKLFIGIMHQNFSCMINETRRR